MISIVFGLLCCLALTQAFLTEQRAVSGFSSVQCAGPFIVTVDITGNESLRIDADLFDVNVTQGILTYVDNGALIVRFDWPYNVGGDMTYMNTIRIYITAINVNSVVNSGSGTVLVNSILTSPSVSLVNSGSGNITLPVNVGDLSIAISGTGNVLVSGVTGNLNAVVSGSGGLGGNGLDATSVSVSVYGSGNVVLNAKSMLSVVMMGSGMVKYRGAPMLNVMNMGTGLVVKIA